MKECCQLMLDYLEKPVKYEALYKKYSQRKFMKGSIFVKDWIDANIETSNFTPWDDSE